MKDIVIGSLCIVLFASCNNVSFILANRSNVYETRQDAQTEGHIEEKPQSNSSSVDAEKTTKLDTAVTTSSGSAATGDKSNKKSEDENTEKDSKYNAKAVTEDSNVKQASENSK